MPYEMLDAGTHYAVRAFGEVSAAEMLTPQELDAVCQRRRLLVDFSEMTEWRIDPQGLWPLHQVFREHAVRVAACAPRSWQWGVVRQAWLVTGFPEGTLANVFDNLDAALEWLLSA